MGALGSCRSILEWGATMEMWRGMECGAAGACTLLGQMRIASDGTEAAVREGGWRMSGVGFLREMGAGSTQV
jgi:hypothetical protein